MRHDYRILSFSTFSPTSQRSWTRTWETSAPEQTNTEERSPTQSAPLFSIHPQHPILVHYQLKAFQCLSPLSQKAEAEEEGQAKDQETLIMFERK